MPRRARARHLRSAAEDPNGERWTYSFHGPYADFATYEKWAHERADFARSAVLRHRRCGDAAGPSASASYMRIEPKHGVIEVGQHLLLAAARADARRHRGHLPVHVECVRAGISPLRVEVRQLQSAVARARPRASGSRTRACSARPSSTRAATATPRGSRSSTGDWNGGLEGRLSTLAGSGELRRGGRAAAEAVGADRAVRARGELSLTASGQERDHVLRDQRGIALEQSLVLVGHVDDLRAGTYFDTRPPASQKLSFGRSTSSACLISGSRAPPSSR